MPDDLPDLNTPVPDRAHEALRQSLMAAVDELAEQVQRINDAFLMLLSTADFAQGTLNTVLAGQAAIAALNTRVDAERINVQKALSNADALQADARGLKQQLAATVDRLGALEARVTAVENRLISVRLT